MTFPSHEFSLIWGGKTLGDAGTLAPYIDSWFNSYLTRMASSSGSLKYGILANTHASYSGNLAPTMPGGAVVRIASGAALNRSYLYLNDANVDFTCSDNGHYHVVLRAIVSQQTVRLVLLGPNPAQYPAAVHTGDINDISIAFVGSSGGVVTAVYDRRKFFRNLSVPSHSGEALWWYLPALLPKRVRGVTIQCGSAVINDVDPASLYPRAYPGSTAPIVILQAAGGADQPDATHLLNRSNDMSSMNANLDDTKYLTAIWWLSFGMSR